MELCGPTLSLMSFMSAKVREAANLVARIKAIHLFSVGKIHTQTNIGATTARTVNEL